MADDLHVLFIDDSEDDVDVLAQLLTQKGHKLTFDRVDTKEEMLQALQKSQYHIVISDYSMPRFNGLEALKLFMALKIDVPFILVSGTVDEELAIEAMRLGASDYIMKGKLKRLAPAIDRELREAKVRLGGRRMHQELSTAKIVQNTLFPRNDFAFGCFEGMGCYQPATECSGDWWHHCEIGGKIYLWIGDVTGHGMAAALITSAVRSVVSVLESDPTLTPARAMGIINKAIYDTSKAQMMMTFFILSLDKVTGELIYCNASHEAPLIFRPSESASAPAANTDHFIFLNKNKNPRLGQNPVFDFIETKTKLEHGDLLFAYTDGLLCLKDTAGKQIGEKRVLRALSESMLQTQEPGRILLSLNDKLAKFRDDTPLEDDVTYFVARYK